MFHVYLRFFQFRVIVGKKMIYSLCMVFGKYTVVGVLFFNRDVPNFNINFQSSTEMQYMFKLSRLVISSISSTVRRYHRGYRILSTKTVQIF